MKFNFGLNWINHILTQSNEIEKTNQRLFKELDLYCALENGCTGAETNDTNVSPILGFDDSKDWEKSEL